MTTNQTTAEQDAAIEQAMIDARTPAGLAKILRSLDHHRLGRVRLVRVLDSIARDVERLQPDAPTIEREWDHYLVTLPRIAVSTEQAARLANFLDEIGCSDQCEAILDGIGCTGAVDDESGLLQHPDETCPVHDSEIDTATCRFPGDCACDACAPDEDVDPASWEARVGFDDGVRRYVCAMRNDGATQSKVDGFIDLHDLTSEIVGVDRAGPDEKPWNGSGTLRMRINCTAEQANAIQAIDGVLSVGR